MNDERKTLTTASSDFAQRKAREIRKQFGSKKSKLAKVLYNKLPIKYGFEESVNTENFGPFPHEIKTQAICFTFATYQYFIAEALGLKPHMYWGYGLKYYREKVNHCSYDHAFIDVDVGTKRRVLIDMHMSIYGHVNYSDNLFTVKDNYVTKYCKCQYDYLQQQSFDEIIDALMHLRTPQGAIGALEQGQKIDQNSMCCFNQDSCVLELHHIVATPIVAKSVFIQKHHFNNEGCIDNSKMEFYMFSHQQGWMQYNRLRHLCTLDMDILDKIFKILRSITKNRRRSHSKEIVNDLIKGRKSIPLKYRHQFNEVFSDLQYHQMS